MRHAFFDIDFVDCIQHLEDDFFIPQETRNFQDKSVRCYHGKVMYFCLNLHPVLKEKTLLDEIADEREYRTKQASEAFKDISRERELALIRKLERRNQAVGDIDKAKNYPIDKIISFNHGFAKCLWHNDLEPSLHFIQERNAAYCFSCVKGFDSIDAYRALHNCSFPEAVKSLSDNIKL